MQQSWTSQNSLTQRMNAMATDVGHLQHSLEGLKLTTQGLDARRETLWTSQNSLTQRMNAMATDVTHFEGR